MQDLSTLERKIITALDKPDNVYVSEKADPVSAYKECKIALLSGYNAAVWNYPALVANEQLRQNVRSFSHFFEENRLWALATIDPKAENLTPDLAFKKFSAHFNTVFDNIAEAKGRCLAPEVSAQLLNEIRQKYPPLKRTFNAATLDLNLDVEGESAYFDVTTQHFDMRQHFGEAVQGWTGDNLAYITVLETMMGHSTIIFDNKDFDAAPSKRRENGWHDWRDTNLTNPTPTLWMPDHFSVSLIACSPWPHMPCIHSFPVKQADKENELRLKIHSYLQFKPSAADLKIVKNSLNLMR